ncbi:FKBP-type peptidyl-prolyl cis-trans isomerase [Mucilaginibacter psychrotolerans]|uniref:peptidylprolyl isomerase n=1 Tax=Mucilaginibacter psychrotolerans TaxID=1524096 RepID=A0A4Y8RYU8_9SPHI|nr:FKBP-type peptidyl-prolyl cis-trans isomerase [Mucilaginibacter psychrotolerans]TFF30394.1 FKBP-type peptidyl-prolyl cis-trans isomerase [Mucilaginibacter psychrotolerans]
MNKKISIGGHLLLTAGLLCTLAFTVHAQRKPAGKPAAPQQQTDVYVGGEFHMGDNTKAIAAYYKNDVLVKLVDDESQSTVYSMFIDGNDVYAAGIHNRQAVYWKNGQEVRLTNSKDGGIASCIIVVKGDVYVTGLEYEMTYLARARCWKNGQTVKVSLDGLGHSIAKYVAVDDNGDVYMAGHKYSQPLYWRNGERVEIIDKSVYLEPRGLVIANKAIYVVGSTEHGVAYWKGGTGTVLLGVPRPTDLEKDKGTSIAVSGNDVYVAGYEEGFVKYWKNGVATVLCKTPEYPDPYYIATDGNDVYVAGYGEGGTQYWKNGKTVALVPGLLVTSIAVKKSEGNAKYTVKITPVANNKQPVTPATTAPSTPKTEADRFLAENKKRPGVTTTASGLQYEIFKTGTGAKPTVSDLIKVNYHGTLLNGDVFESTINRGEPITLSLKDMVEGLKEGLQLMNAGGKYKFFIPANLAYGNQAIGNIIKPGSLIVMEVELLEVVR